MAEHIAQRLHSDGPKRMLSLDGGGVRGAVTLGFLVEIEKCLANRFADTHYGGDASQFRLAHYYDMIGGTSVGSMIATQLAWGESVNDIRERFKTSAPKIFKRGLLGRVGTRVIGSTSDYLQQSFSNLFDARTVRGAAWGVVGNEPLRSEGLKTGLTIVAKRLDTGSVWVLNNNPAGPFFDHTKDYPLPDLIRASTAAPTYFSPKSINVYDADSAVIKGLFVDGGVSPYNNPALKLLLMAGVRGYNLGGATKGGNDYPACWSLGPEQLMITSVGTGSFTHSLNSMNNGLEAANALFGVTGDAQELTMTLMQWMSAPNRSWNVDRVYGDLAHDNIGAHLGDDKGLFSFQRYDALLENEWLENLTGKSYTDGRIKALRDFTNARALDELFELGERAAADQVQPEDFPDVFNGPIYNTGAYAAPFTPTA